MKLLEDKEEDTDWAEERTGKSEGSEISDSDDSNI